MAPPRGRYLQNSIALPSPLVGKGAQRIPPAFAFFTFKNGRREALAYAEAKPSEGG
jgi:hypothetical protein